MKLLLDFLPILIFFGAYKLTEDLITATAVLIPVTIIQVAVVYWLTKKVEKMALVTLVLVIIFGGLTVFLNDGWFIMWKPTVVIICCGILWQSLHWTKTDYRTLTRPCNFAEPQQWVTLSFAWIAFFIFSGVLNLIVAYQFSEDVWVNFKLFGLLGLTFIFLIIQGVWISKHGLEVQAQPEDDQNA